MATGPKLTGPVERLGTFRHFLNSDTCSSWNVASTSAMVSLANVVAGDRIYVADVNLSQWLAIPAASLPVTTDCLNGTGSSVQYLRHGIPLASATVNGLMSSAEYTALAGLRTSRFKAANNTSMQAIATAQVGDDCVVSTSTADSLWLAVAANKYTRGQNCLAGTGIDWLYQIDRITGTATLVSGHASVYIPNFPTDSIVQPSYSSIIGQSGTLYSPPPTSTGFEIYSTAGAFDGSIVSFSCVLGA